MTVEDRQQMNVRAIRVSLNSALRYASPDQAQACKARARQLLAHARRQTTAAAVISEIEMLDAELDGGALGQGARRELEQNN